MGQFWGVNNLFTFDFERHKMSEFGPDFGKQASGTFENYLAGTVLLVFIVFFIFIIMSMFTMMLMGYARYNTRRPVPPGFNNPPPMAYRPKLVIDQGQGGTMTQQPSTGQSTLL